MYRDVAGAAPNAPMDVPGVGEVPATPNGKQALYVSGTGSAWAMVTFPRAGVFAIDFQAAGEFGPDMGNPLDFYLDDRRITPNGGDLVPPPYPWWPGNGDRDAGKFSAYGTVPVEIPKPGQYTFRVVGRGSADRTTVIDDVRVASLDAIFQSRIPTGVRAAGEVSRTSIRTQLADQASYAQAYGLKVVAYEGGWSLGGNGTSVPLQSWAKYRDPRTASIMTKAIDAFYQASGEVYFLGTFDQWYLDDAVHADDYPIVNGIDNALAVLPAVPTARIVVRGFAPVTLSAAMGVRALSMPVYAAPGDWVSWTVRVAASGEYRITAQAAPDGSAAVYVDGAEVGRGLSGLAPGGVVHIESGVHAVRVQSTGGWFVIRGATLDRLDEPPAP